MVASCCICKIESGQQEDVSFHRIPKNEERKRQWLLAIGREVGKYSAVCSLHFAPNDFYNICEGIRRRLLPTAVPSAALPSVTQSIQKFENGSAVSKDFTASDKSQENHGESLHLMPTTSRLFDNTAVPLIEPANVPLCVQKISEPAVAPEQTHKRKWKDMCSKSAKRAKRIAVPRYIGDIGPDDFKSYMSWLIVEKYVNNVRPKLKTRNQTIRRLKKRVNLMSDKLKRVRGKGLLSTEATNALSVSNSSDEHSLPQDIFLNIDNMLDQSLLSDYQSQLFDAILKKYFKIRLHHEGASRQDRIDRIRIYRNKLVLFCKPVKMYSGMKVAKCLLH